MLFGLPQIILDLLIHPAFRRGVKRDGQPHRHFWSNARAAIQEAGERRSADAERSGRFGDA